MKVKILVCMAGVDYVRTPGDVSEVDDAEGSRLIEAGFAELAEPPAGPKVEPKPAFTKPSTKK